MNTRTRTTVAAWALLTACLSLVATATADVKLPAIIGDHMVLQQDMKLPIWGTAEPGEKVTVQLMFAGDMKDIPKPITAEATADAKGKWMVKLPAMKASGTPYTLTVAGKNTLTLTDILVGEVWIGSGQSNMDMNVGGSDNAKEIIAGAAELPNIRLIHVPNVNPPLPQDDIKAAWQVCSPQSLPSFSAVLFNFGKCLNKELKVPVGLIHSAWGGSRIEPWTPVEGVKSVERFADLAKKMETARDANQPTPECGMYNGMIHPLVPFAFRGAIWYQGESNVGEGMLYADRMKALVAGWGAVWKNEDMPFYFVQIAPYRYSNGTNENLPKLWEAQAAALAIPHTGMAVIYDVGNYGDIHPRNKVEPGRRLALWALAKDYGKKNLVYSGPMFKSAKVKGATIVVSFDCIGGGLGARDNKPLTEFMVAGEDKVFVPAEAKIDGKTVVVSSDKVAKPMYIRFAWRENPVPNLINKEGLPAVQFRTDTDPPAPKENK